MSPSKKIVAIVACSVIISLFSVGGASAAAPAQFPNSKTLQPLPSPDIKPNISGNVNSVGTVTATEPVQNQITAPEDTEIVVPPQQTSGDIKTAEKPKDENDGYRLIAYTSLALIAIALIAYFAKRKIV
jgi:hypothetical protein